jgi:hypothetical protein
MINAQAEKFHLDYNDVMHQKKSLFNVQPQNKLRLFSFTRGNGGVAGQSLPASSSASLVVASFIIIYYSSLLPQISATS